MGLGRTLRERVLRRLYNWRDSYKGSEAPRIQRNRIHTPQLDVPASTGWLKQHVPVGRFSREAPWWKNGTANGISIRIESHLQFHIINVFDGAAAVPDLKAVTCGMDGAPISFLGSMMAEILEKPPRNASMQD